MRKPAVVANVTLIGLLALCASAPMARALPSAGNVSTSTDSRLPIKYITYSTSYGTSKIVVSNSADGRTATFHDVGGGSINSSDPECSGSGTATVVCVSSSVYDILEVFGGTGNDVIDISGWRPVTRVSAYETTSGGGDGADVFIGSPGYDQFAAGNGADVAYGGAADDFLDGGMGADRLYGEDGDDSLRSGAGPLDALWHDYLYCGSGNDGVHFASPDTAIACEYRF
jgi:hypothetical protein